MRFNIKTSFNNDRKLIELKDNDNDIDILYYIILNNKNK